MKGYLCRRLVFDWRHRPVDEDGYFFIVACKNI
jgi:hypothetical protein